MTVGDLVVVGASLAGLRAVQAARRSGHRRRITLVGAEAHLPYSRPPLSKAFLAASAGTDAPLHRGADALAVLGAPITASPSRPWLPVRWPIASCSPSSSRPSRYADPWPHW
jgi:hypothetical protein